MEKRVFRIHYHGIPTKNFVGVAWVIFESTPQGLDEIDYGDSIISEPKGAIGNTACFVAATEMLKYFKKNYPHDSILIMESCNKIVANQLSGHYKIGEGSYVEYAKESLSVMKELKDSGCIISSLFYLDNKAKELAHLTKQQ